MYNSNNLRSHILTTRATSQGCLLLNVGPSQQQRNLTIINEDNQPAIPYTFKGKRTDRLYKLSNHWGLVIEL